jgi:hypothetical protein
MNNNSHNRLFASQSSSFRQYAENYDEVIKICEETGRKPAEVLRDAIDEWLCMRRAGMTGSDEPPQHEQKLDIYATFEEIQRSIGQLTEQIEKLAESYNYVQQRDHGYLIEILTASYGARNMLWREIANMMRKGNHTEESIQKQYNNLEAEWRTQTNTIMEEISKIISKGKHNA